MQQINPVGDYNRGRDYANPAMNRIKELREAAGLTQEDLGERLGITATHVWRLESGRTALTVEWMEQIAEILHVAAADLIANVVLAEIVDEVEPVEADAVTRSIGAMGLRVYRVTARSVIKTGIQPGDIITVNEADAATKAPNIGDVVLVEMRNPKAKAKARVLRQYVPPDMLVTNRGGANLAITLDDPSVEPVIVGVVLRGQ